MMNAELTRSRGDGMTATYSKQAKKKLESMESATKQRIRKAIAEMPKGDIKPLKGAPGNYRLRVGDWRVLFAYTDADKVHVKKIGPRGEVYKGGAV